MSPARRVPDLLAMIALLVGVALLCLSAIDWVAYQGFLLSLLQR